MTSVECAEPVPRRKWGWIFIALFVIELIAFGALVSSRKAKIEQLQAI